MQLVGCSREERVALVKEWNWDERLELTTPSFRLREPVLALRRCILRIFDMRDQEANMWLKVRLCRWMRAGVSARGRFHTHAHWPSQIAQAARSDRHYPTASSSLLHASRLGCTAAQIETAEMLYDQGQVRAWCLAVAITRHSSLSDCDPTG